MLTSGNFSGIKSVQYVAIGMADGSASASAAISAVNTAKATLQFLGYSTEGTLLNGAIYATLTNATTVSASRRGPTGAATVSCCVTEFY